MSEETNETNGRKHLRGLAIQRRDLFFDAYVLDVDEEIGNGVARSVKLGDTSIIPNHPPIASGIRLCEVKRVFKENGIARKRIHMRYLDCRDRKAIVNEEFREKYGTDKAYIAYLDETRRKINTLMECLDKQRTAESFESTTGVASNEFTEFSSAVSQMRNASRSAVFKLEEMLSAHKDAAQAMGIALRIVK